VDPVRVLAEADVVLEETELPGFGIDLIDRHIGCLLDSMRSGTFLAAIFPEKGTM
jgi:hypothetical protein